MVSLTFPQSALQNWLRPERSGQVARVVNILLIIWVAWLLAGLIWRLLPAPEQEAPQQPVVTAPVVTNDRAPRIDEQQIADWHVFGVAGEDKPVPKAAVEAPDTSLKLTLSGVFASEEAGQARAIVGDPRGKEDHYAVGDPLPGGAKLSEIYPDRIILERNGRYETLRLPKDRTSAVLQEDSEPGSAAGPGDSAGKVAAFTKYRNEVKQNPSAFMNYVRATPARGDDGKFIGFRLQAGPERGALKELGLQAGDIVTSINGVQIDSPAKGMKAMQALGEGDSVSVTLLRGGQETTLTLTMPAGNK